VKEKKKGEQSRQNLEFHAVKELGETGRWKIQELTLGRESFIRACTGKGENQELNRNEKEAKRNRAAAHQKPGGQPVVTKERGNSGC